MLPLRPATMLELGTLKLLRLFLRVQQEDRPCGDEDIEEERDMDAFARETSIQLVS